MVAQLPLDMDVLRALYTTEIPRAGALRLVSSALPELMQRSCALAKEIELVASEVTVVPVDTLRVDLLMHTDEITGMTAYSVALQVFDAESGREGGAG